MVSMNEVQEGVYRIENNLDKSKNTIFLRQEYIALCISVYFVDNFSEYNFSMCLLNKTIEREKSY